MQRWQHFFCWIVMLKTIVMKLTKLRLQHFFLFSTLLGIFLCFSCKDDDASSQVRTFQEGDDLRIDDVALGGIFPLEDYSNNSAIIYKNAGGLEYRFPISLTETIIQCPNELGCADANYTANIIEVELKAERRNNYRVNFKLEPDINATDLTYDYCVLASVLAFSIIIDENDPFPESMIYSIFACESTYEPSGRDLELLDIPFDDVIALPVVVNSTTVGFTKAYYTTELGLAAFEDEFNELYIFDRYE